MLKVAPGVIPKRCRRWLSMRSSLVWLNKEPTEGRFKTLRFGEVMKLASDLTMKDPGAEADMLAKTLDEWFVGSTPLVVADVAIQSIQELEVLVRFLVDPAFINGCDLLLVGSEPVEHQFRDSGDDLRASLLWTRLQYIKQRAGARPTLDGLPPLTPIEEMLLEQFRAAGLSPRVQYDISPFRVDFAFEDIRLAVEADGREWHDADRDRARDQKLSELGWQIMHFSGAEIWADARSCAEQVVARIGTLATQGSAASTDVDRECASTHSQQRTDLDPEQREAVTARAGIVQVIAPAGSGKTTVLVERVRFLLSHGMPASRILSTTFNTDARNELRKRFDAAGISQDAETRTFHSLGRQILLEEGELPPTRLTSYSWKRLARIVSDRTGQWIEPEELEGWISHYKLIEMKTPDELDTHPSDEIGRARILAYALYEEDRERRKAWAFDDLLFLAVRLLQTDARIREKWQKRWWYILVDEYQDIEPAQEQLITLLSSPHDNLFIVGDEDQCIYTWRRADVRRIMSLYRRYPSVKRCVLRVNYRSGKAIVAASRVLIENNKIRFTKDISAFREDLGTITRLGFSEDPLNVDQLNHAFELIRACSDPTEMAVLCRTNTLLRDLAIRCVSGGVEISANDRILKPSLVEEVVLAYLMICFRPEEAAPADIETAFRNPNVYLRDAHAALVLNGLRAGRSFSDSFASLPMREEWRVNAQTTVASRLDNLKAQTSSSLAMIHLRREIGLDDHFDARDREGAQSEDADALNSVSALAGAVATPRELVDVLRQRRDALERARSGQGVELTSIHGAKGREWSNVVLIGADDQRLPLASVIENQSITGFGATSWEDERRLAYVAMTRAKDALTLCWSNEASPFVLEALDGDDSVLLEQRTRQRQAERKKAREEGSKQRVKQSRSATGAKVFAAKRTSVCHLCDAHIVPNEMATWLNDQVVHTRCVSDEAEVRRVPGQSLSSDVAKQGLPYRRRTPTAGRSQPVSRGRRGFPAKYPGTCHLCGKHYQKEDLIIPLDDRYVHVKCGLS
jgi:DNA helicase-2/ATP-dependent DNA helicase PcrA